MTSSPLDMIKRAFLSSDLLKVKKFKDILKELKKSQPRSMPKPCFVMFSYLDSLPSMSWGTIFGAPVFWMSIWYPILGHEPPFPLHCHSSHEPQVSHGCSLNTPRVPFSLPPKSCQLIPSVSLSVFIAYSTPPGATCKEGTRTGISPIRCLWRTALMGYCCKRAQPTLGSIKPSKLLLL